MNLSETMALPCPSPSMQHPRPDPAHLIKAPYGRKAADWDEARQVALKHSGVGMKTQDALRWWTIQETRAGKSLDFTPHQLAKAGGCSVRTIYRDIAILEQANLIEMIATGNRGARKASLFRLSLAMPEWGGFTAARSPGKKFHVPKCPSPGVLRTLDESPTYPPTTATETTPIPSHQAHESASGVDVSFTEKTSLPKEKEHLRGQEKALAEDLLQAGCQLPGVLAAVKSASLDGRVKEARTDVRAVLAYLQLHPGWVKNPAGLLIRSVQDPARARVIRRQFRYSRTKERRARESEAKVTKAEAANAPEPIRIDLRELLEDSREIFQDLAPEVRSTIEACVNRVGHANRDRAFIDAVGQAIREARCSA